MPGGKGKGKGKSKFVARPLKKHTHTFPTTPEIRHLMRRAGCIRASKESRNVMRQWIDELLLPNMAKFAATITEGGRRQTVSEGDVKRAFETQGHKIYI